MWLYYCVVSCELFETRIHGYQCLDGIATYDMVFIDKIVNIRADFSLPDISLAPYSSR